MNVELNVVSFLAMSVASAFVFALVKNLGPKETAREFIIILGKLAGGFLLIGAVAYVLCR